MNDTNSTLGTTTIAPDVLLTIAQLTATSVDGLSHMSHAPGGGVNRLLKRGLAREGVQIEIVDDMVYADLYVVLKNGYNVREVSQNIQHDVARAISEMVGMQVGCVNVHIEDIDYPPETEAEA